MDNKMATRLYFDGSMKDEDSSCGFVLDGLLRIEETHHTSAKTAAEAEYHGLILGLRKAITLGVSNLQIYGDHKPLIEQLSGRSKARTQCIRKLRDEAVSLLELIPNHTVRWVPSAGNIADKFSR